MTFDLEGALRQYPLPEALSDAVVNRGQCATALGVSEPMITRYLEQGMPVSKKGANGQAYEFQLSEVYAWKMWRDGESRARSAEAEKAAMQMALLFRNDDDGEPDAPVLTADQIAKESEADYKRNKAAELRGELVRTARVRELFEDVLVEFRTQITTLVDFAEVEFGLEPDQVEKIQARCDAVLVTSRQKLERTCPSSVTSIDRAAARQVG